MKKKLSIVLAALLAVCILAGCGTEKLDTSPHSFGEEESAQTVLPAPDGVLPEETDEAAEGMPADEQGEAQADDIPAPEAPAQAADPLDESASEAADEAASGSAPDEVTDVEDLPLEPAGDAEIGPAEGPLAGNADSAVEAPYAVNEEEEAQLFDSPAAEAEALGLDEVPERAAENGGAAAPGDAPESLEDVDALPAEPAADPGFGPGEDLPAAPEDGGNLSADGEGFMPSEADLLFADNVAGQAFAVAMAYWDSGYGVETSPSEPAFAWDALGWYAAWLYRTQELDLIAADTAEAFMASLGCEDTGLIPEEVMDYGMPRALRGRDGVSYDFGLYKDRIDELLGVEVEMSVIPAAEKTVDAVVTQHFDGGLQGETVYTLGFEAGGQADGEFPWALQSVTLPDFAPEVDPALTFTWEELEQANLLENVLAEYPAVRMYSSEFPENGSTWLFSRDENPVLVVEGPDYCSGQYKGCWFDVEEDDKGVTRARIGAFDSSAGSWAALNSMLLESFRDASALRLDRIEEDLIWADCLYRGGERQKLAFDRETLVLRELVVLSEEGEVLGSNCYDYTPEPEFEFLDSWDKSLREVTVTWENFDGQEQNRYTETVSIPVDWEYLPYECRWGDYTAYTNEDYIGEYEYPGDNIDYELFLTTAKG